MTKMKNWWTTRLSGKISNKHAVKLSQLKLELGLFGTRVATTNDKVAIEITGIAASEKGKEQKPSFPFHRTSKRRCTHTTSCRRFLSAKTPSLVWDARDLCGFNLVLKDSCDITFHVLYGEGAVGESKGKTTVVGKVSMTLATAELLLVEEMKRTESNSHHHLQRRLPIRLKVNGLIIEATLLVSLRLLKLRSSDDDSPEPFENSVQSRKKNGIIGKVKYLTSWAKKTNGKFDEAERPYDDSDGSPVFDSDDSSNESTTSSGSDGISKNSGNIYNAESSRLALPSSETRTRLDTLQRSWSQLSRNRSFKGWTNTSKQETLTTYQGPSTKSDELSPRLYHQSNASRWEMKEISSRDGQAKFKANVFFASFDQRSEKASGESACTVLVALIAHWLHSNQGMPKRSQFDSLITQGSSEWRKLCNSDYYSKLFPDKHFDLETIIEAKLRPLIIQPQKSYTGFFSPEKFQCLKGAMSFDEIWDEIKSNKVVDYESRVYILSWNDHFFVLKVEADAYYIIDSLGERLFEGCQRAFILKFDDSCVMYGKAEAVEGATSKGKNSGAKSVRKSEERLEIVCHGKECCKEFIKRFLAAIPLRQLEKEKMKWTGSNPYIHRQLQVDFHFSSLSSSSTTSLMSFLTSGYSEA